MKVERACNGSAQPKQLHGNHWPFAVTGLSFERINLWIERVGPQGASMKSLVLAFFAAILLGISGGAASAEPIHGAGSTFAYPVIAKWSESYLADRAGGSDITFMGSGIDYEPVGSHAGILRLAQPEMDFAASDMPLPPEELKKFGYVQF